MQINILEKYFPELNTICNSIKQQNIYHNKSIQYHLWNEFCEKNIPFLIVLSNFIQTEYANKNVKDILFTTRDCIFLKRLFNHLYPNIKSETFYASRALYLFPTQDYSDYCKSILTPDSLVIDFQGTGQSFKTMTSTLNVEPWYLLVNWNSAARLAYSQEYLHTYAKKITIREKRFFDDAIEKLNIDLVGTYFDFKNNKAISYTYEYDPQIISAFHKCFDLFINCIDKYNIDLIKQYEWDNNFNQWMDKYYTNSPIINSMKWIHTHFQYDADNIDRIRKEYQNAKNS
jgi:hypothetical protein